MNQPPKSLYDYQSYREYLLVHFLSEKKSTKKTSSAAYAARLGMSASAFSMVLSGQRNLALEKIQTLAGLLNLSDAEVDYFEALVLKAHLAGDPESVKFYSRRLKRLAENTTTKRHRTSDRNLVSNWFVPALLIRLIDFEKASNPQMDIHRLDFKSIGQKFNMNENQTRKLIESLEKTGILAINPSDQFHIVFDKVSARLNQKSYVQAVCSEMSGRIRNQFEDKNSLFKTFVFTMNKTVLTDFKKELTALFEKYMAATSKVPAENEIFRHWWACFRSKKTN